MSSGGRKPSVAAVATRLNLVKIARRDSGMLWPRRTATTGETIACARSYARSQGDAFESLPLSSCRQPSDSFKASHIRSNVYRFQLQPALRFEELGQRALSC